MRIHAVLCIAAASFVLSGCATRQEPNSKDMEVLGIPPGTPACNNAAANGSCVIDLIVSDLSSTACQIAPVNADDDLILMRPGGGPFVVYWRILPSAAGHADYVFDEDDGIAFINNFGPRGFKGGRRDANDAKVYRWRNLNKTRKIYAYIVNVTDTSGTRDCFLDPWIRNK